MLSCSVNALDSSSVNDWLKALIMCKRAETVQCGNRFRNRKCCLSVPFSPYRLIDSSHLEQIPADRAVWTQAQANFDWQVATLVLPLHHYSLRSTCMIHVTGGHPQHSQCCKVFMQTHLHANAVVFNAFAHFVGFPVFSAPLALTPVLHGVPRSTSYFLVWLLHFTASS